MAEHKQTAPQTPRVTSAQRPQKGVTLRGMRVKTGIRAGYELTRSYESTFESSSSISRTYHFD